MFRPRTRRVDTSSWFRRRTTTRRLFVVAAMALLSTSVAFGQSGSAVGSIQGIVADGTGAILPGVTITATSPSELGARSAVSNEKGEYRFPRLNPGDYKLTFE